MPTTRNARNACSKQNLATTAFLKYLLRPRRAGKVIAFSTSKGYLRRVKIRVKASLFYLIFSFFVVQVAAATPCALKIIYPPTARPILPVQVDFRVEGDGLFARFEVRSPAIFAKPILGRKEFPYMFDVVEVFVSTSSSHFPYYEFELSPLGQTLQVKIEDLHRPFLTGRDQGLQSRTSVVSGGWIGELRIPLRNLGWNGDPRTIVGNAYAVLGKGPARRYT